MISSTLIKCWIAALLFAAQASAFTLPAVAGPTTVTAGGGCGGAPLDTRQHYDRDVVSCYAAANKRENCPGKTAFKSGGNKVAGIGGMGGPKSPTFGKKAPSSSSVANDKKKVVRAAAAAPKKAAPKVVSNNKNNKSVGEAGATTKTPWSSIILAFLTPWRNPNSLFLYMIIAVSVLGEINKK